MFIDPSTTKTKLRWSGTFALLHLPHVAPAGASMVLLCFSYKHFAPTALAELFQSRTTLGNRLTFAEQSVRRRGHCSQL
jgi:hypothetical protein